MSHTNLDTSGASLPHPPAQPDFSLDEFVVMEDEVLNVLQSLDTNKASGPDGISARILREAAPIIASSLTDLINLSLRSHKFPTSWKRANVIALHKKNERSDVKNYRPTSLLCCVSKVMEKCIFKHVFNFLRDHSLITRFQSGFVPNDSTVNQLVELYHLFSEALDHKKDVKCVFCDISKAFDKVWHKGILFKLKQIGINNSLLLWFSSYLSHRQQRVVINGCESSWGFVNAGVPQGSVLGPLLFLVYINDIVDVVNSNIRLFADDTTLYVTTDDINEGSTILNADLQSIMNWSHQWLITFSPPKTESLLATLKHDTPVGPPLIMNNDVITEVTAHKHLGVTFSQNLSWTNHILDICQKTSKRLDILTGLKNRLDRKSLEIMYFFLC